MDFVPGISADVWLNRVNLASHLFHINKLLEQNGARVEHISRNHTPRSQGQAGLSYREPKTDFQTFNNNNAKSLKTKPEFQN